jgi:hypothetical protein
MECNEEKLLNFQDPRGLELSGFEYEYSFRSRKERPQWVVQRTSREPSQDRPKRQGCSLFSVRE